MWDATSSLKFLEDTVDDIESYLLSKDVIRARSGRPSLSLGLVSLDLRWLSAALEADDQDRLLVVDAELKEVKDKWQVAWERKATAELRSRLNLWREYLGDLRQRSGLASSYSQEVRNRAIAVDLVEAAGNQPELEALSASLDVIDLQLKDEFAPGVFIWERVPATAFTSEPFWFLYGRPRSRD